MNSPLSRFRVVTRRELFFVIAAVFLSSIAARQSFAVVYGVTVDGPDAIFLAGRTDLVIPPPGDPWFGPGDYLIRHAAPTPEEAIETLPPFIPVAGGDVIKVLDPAVGGINFFNGYGPPYYGPSGNGADGSNLTSLGGISGYIGPQGPLAGVFLNDAIPEFGLPPATLDFSPGGLGIDFSTLSPALRQIFYIGDGVNSSAEFQTFIAPAGATRLFLAIPDGFGFGGGPGAYDDNDGRYLVRIGVNEEPTIPEPSALLLLSVAGLGLFGIRWR